MADADAVGFPGDNDQMVGGEGAVMAADSGSNDKRFYTLMELVEMEPMLERRYYDGGG